MKIGTSKTLIRNGTLEAGKHTDIIVVDGDVLADFSTVKDRSKFVAVP